MALHDITLQYITNTLHYTMNFNGKVTIQQNEKYVLITYVTRVHNPKAELTTSY